MKYGWLKGGLMLASALTLFAAGAAARQSPTGGVTKEEADEARAAAAAFAGRLRETQDFGAVVRELYADDFMSGQLKGLSGGAKGGGSGEFMLEGIPSLTFERSLAARAGVEDWKRVRVAADNLLHFTFLSLLSNLSFQDLGEPEKYDKNTLLGVFPPEAVKALDANPAASNLLLKKGSGVVVRTPEELRALASTLEEAVSLTRPRLAQFLAKGKHLEANLRLMGEGLAREEVRLARGEADRAGYPEGTRLLRVFAPNAYVLLLVRQGGALKIVHAGLPHD